MNVEPPNVEPPNVEPPSLVSPSVPVEGWRPAGSVLVLHTTVRVVRAWVVSDRGVVLHRHDEVIGDHTPDNTPDHTDGTPGDSLDAAAIATAVLRAALAAVGAAGGVRAIALATTPGVLVAWEADEGDPVAATVGCRDAEATGRWLDGFDPERQRALLVGPLASWVIWTLTEGARQVTDVAAAAATGLLATDGSGWDPAALTTARLHPWALPQLASGAGPLAEAIPVTGCPPILANCSDRVAAILGAGGGDPAVQVVRPAPDTDGAVVARWLGPAGDAASVDATAVDSTAVALVARSRRWLVREEEWTSGLAASSTSTPAVLLTADDQGRAEPSPRPAATAIEFAAAPAVVAEADAVCWGAFSIVGVALGRWTDPAEGPRAEPAVAPR